jgi:hypothetical protein
MISSLTVMEWIVKQASGGERLNLSPKARGAGAPGSVAGFFLADGDVELYPEPESL